MAFAVDDRFHGRGIATALLERLTLYGRDQNFERFTASAPPENLEYARLYSAIQDSRSARPRKRGLSKCACRLQLFAGEHRCRGRARAPGDDRIVPSDCEPSGGGRYRCVAPRSNLGRRVLEALTRLGFTGPIYPVNLVIADLGGVRCYLSARDLPSGVDSPSSRSPASPS